MFISGKVGSFSVYTELCGNGEFVHCIRVCQACVCENQPPLLRSCKVLASFVSPQAHIGAAVGCWAVEAEGQRAPSRKFQK